MPGSVTVPNAFATQSGNVPAAQIDADLSAITVYINAREITYGLLSARPSAAVAGRYWYATDTRQLFGDTGAAWLALGMQAITLAQGELLVGTATGVPSNLPTSTNTFVLTLDNTVPLGVKWGPQGGVSSGIGLGLMQAMLPHSPPVL